MINVHVTVIKHDHRSALKECATFCGTVRNSSRPSPTIYETLPHLRHVFSWDFTAIEIGHNAPPRRQWVWLFFLPCLPHFSFRFSRNASSQEGLHKFGFSSFILCPFASSSIAFYCLIRCIAVATGTLTWVYIFYRRTFKRRSYTGTVVEFHL